MRSSSSRADWLVRLVTDWGSSVGTESTVVGCSLSTGSTATAESRPSNVSPASAKPRVIAAAAAAEPIGARKAGRRKNGSQRRCGCVSGCSCEYAAISSARDRTRYPSRRTRGAPRAPSFLDGREQRDQLGVFNRVHARVAAGLEHVECVGEAPRVEVLVRQLPWEHRHHRCCGSGRPNPAPVALERLDGLTAATLAFSTRRW